jgi:CheY-specific phosphatase CheX
MELIQPFINAADAVLAESLRGATRIDDVSMEPEVYRRKGIAAKIVIRGDIEGRVIFDMAPPTAAAIASAISGSELPEGDSMVNEAICELANQVIGNAVTALNDEGFAFKVFPPEVHCSDEGLHGNEDTEALVMCFETTGGPVYMNIAMHYHRRRRHDRSAAIDA